MLGNWISNKFVGQQQKSTLIKIVGQRVSEEHTKIVNKTIDPLLTDTILFKQVSNAQFKDYKS